MSKNLILIILIVLLVVPLGIAAFLHFSPNYSDNELKGKAKEIVAGKLNTNADNVHIKTWYNIGEFDGIETYAASLFLNNDKEKNYLGIFEKTKSGNLSLISLNEKILNVKNNSTDTSRTYDIISDYMFANGFCLSNGESYYYFVVRPQRDAREILLCYSFRRTLSEYDLGVVQDVDSEFKHIPFGSFAQYYLPAITSNPSSKTLVDYMPEILSNNDEFILTRKVYAEDSLTIYIELYKDDGSKPQSALVKEVELLESPHNEIKLKVTVENTGKSEKYIYITAPASTRGEYDTSSPYPYSMSIGSGTTTSDPVRLLSGIDERWSNVTFMDNDQANNILMSYYIPAEFEYISSYSYTTGNRENKNRYYFVGATSDDESAFFTFKADAEGVLHYVGQEKLGREFFKNGNDEYETLDVSWEQSVDNKEAYILTIYRSETINNTEVSQSESFRIQVNSKGKMYFNESWKTELKGETIETSWTDYSQSYTLEDYINNKSKLNVNDSYTQKINMSDTEGKWFIAAMSSDTYTQKAKRAIALSIYNESVSLNYDPQLLSIINSLHEWGYEDEAYKILQEIKQTTENDEDEH